MKKFNLPLVGGGGLAMHSIVQIFVTLVVSLFALRLSAGLLAWRTANKLEQPPYEIIKTLPMPGVGAGAGSPRGGWGRRSLELRKYSPYLIAETTVDESSMRKAGGVGFGRCASYIFGKNLSRGDQDSPEKMAMTSPVRSVGSSESMAMTAPVRGSTSSSSGKTKISFVIGSKYNLRNVPRPVDRAVTVKKVNGHFLAATSFSGPPPSDAKVAQERQDIVAALQNEGIRVKNKDETIVYGYHDPIITPNILRKNEVGIMIDGSGL